MDKTYFYTKKFIERNVKKLGKPLEVDDELKKTLHEIEQEGSTLTPKQIQQIVDKTNTLIRRHNRNVFPAQVVNQMVQQVIKCEQTKMHIVNEKLGDIDGILQPILIPDFDEVGGLEGRIEQLGELVRELPESRYILVGGGKGQEDELEKDEDELHQERDLGSGNQRLVQDGQEMVETMPTEGDEESKLKLMVDRELLPEKDGALARQYDALRKELVEIYHLQRYKCDKLNYLRQLRDTLATTFNCGQSQPQHQPTYQPNANRKQQVVDSDEEVDTQHQPFQDLRLHPDSSLHSQITRFQILVEKLALKLGPHQFQQLNHQIQTDAYNSIVNNAQDP